MHLDWSKMLDIRHTDLANDKQATKANKKGLKSTLKQTSTLKYMNSIYIEMLRDFGADLLLDAIFHIAELTEDIVIARSVPVQSVQELFCDCCCQNCFILHQVLIFSYNFPCNFFFQCFVFRKSYLNCWNHKHWILLLLNSSEDTYVMTLYKAHEWKRALFEHVWWDGNVGTVHWNVIGGNIFEISSIWDNGQSTKSKRARASFVSHHTA